MISLRNALVILLGIVLSLSTLVAGVNTNFDQNQTYLIKVGGYLTLELPGGDDYKIVGSSRDWETELLTNYVWLKPKKAGKFTLKILNSKGECVVLNAEARDELFQKKVEKVTIAKPDFKAINTKKEPPKAKPIELAKPKAVIAKSISDSISKDLEKKGVIGETPTPRAVPKKKKPKKSVEKPKSKEKNFNVDTYVSLFGGMENTDENRVTVDGEIAIAGQGDSGLHLQGSAMVSVNNLISQYGLSLGGGYEPGKLGFFLFGDLTLYKLGDFGQTFHFQIKPAIRYKTKRIQASAFYAHPITGEVSTGSEIEWNGEIQEVYNKALAHFGFDLKASLLKKLFLGFTGLIAADNVYKFDVEAGYELFKKLLLQFKYSYSNYGKYPLLIGQGINKGSKLSCGVTYGVGGTHHVDDWAESIIFKTSYGLIATYGKKIGDTDQPPTDGLAVILTGTPTSGYANLNVQFTAELKTPPNSQGHG